MLQRAGSKFRSSVFSRKMFLYAVVLFAFFGISISEASNSIHIIVEIDPTSETITLEVDRIDTVRNVKRLIEKEKGIPYDKQILIFRERILDDSQFLEYYGILLENSRLRLAVRASSPSPSYPDDNLQFFRLCDECMLPATGFSSLFPAALSVQPKDLRYTDVGMRLMIPSLDLDSELVSVPMDGNSWAVEWLDDRGGVLEGSALPGEGFSVVAAHNTLNDTEYGPFALLGTLELNELIAVSGIGSDLRTFRVFANELLSPDDMEKLASIAEREENTLVLITCENESADGGYLNRRAVFAKPVF